MRSSGCLLLALGALTAPAIAQTAHPAVPALSPAVTRYVKYSTAKNTLWLEHVRVIDGTGAAPLENATVILLEGKIAAILPPTHMEANAGHMEAWSCTDCAPALHLDLTGRTIFPGLVGMHDHLYYIARPNLDEQGHSEPPLIVPEMPFTSLHLYLGAGVTTMRTTGSVEPYTDLNLRRDIDAGEIPGPHLDITGPYLEGPNSPFIQMHNLKDAADAKATVDFWAAQGVTSYKAYMNITRAELKAAIDEAHKLGHKLTGHLCAVTYPEAAELGIDNLEHGFFVNTQLDPGKQPDLCPSTYGGPTLLAMTPNSPDAKALIALLIQHHVAVTSTLPVFESDDPTHFTPQQRVLDTMSPNARQAYLNIRTFELARTAADPKRAAERVQELTNDTGLEHEFVTAGGLLMAGPDPTGDGGVLPGFGDQRELELLVQRDGFTPLEAIKIATLNGATFLNRANEIGTVAPGKNADLVIVKGDPSQHITDIENTELVFKDGIGFDSQALLDSAKGRYGQY
jgi:imidazolonepropionase-like amidohydrolase